MKPKKLKKMIIQLLSIITGIVFGAVTLVPRIATDLNTNDYNSEKVSLVVGAQGIMFVIGLFDGPMSQFIFLIMTIVSVLVAKK